VHSFTTSDGVRLNYYIDDYTDPWTKPPTLLLLHPAMGTAKRYYAMVPKFARQYRTVRLDLRGHGNSQIPDDALPFSLERLAQVLESIGRRDQGKFGEHRQLRVHIVRNFVSVEPIRWTKCQLHSEIHPRFQRSRLG